MFDRLIHLWARYVGDIGVWHARNNYPRDEHGVPWPIYGDTPVNTGGASNVTPFRMPMEERHD